jgi:hypothetical protein
MGFRGGVDDLQVSETTYRITARGNGFTSSQRVQDFVLLRASEIAISRGYSGFVIDGMADQSRVYQYTTPGHATTTTTGSIVGGGGYASVTANSTTTYTPPVTNTIFKPGAAVMVTLVQEGGLNAHMIYDNLSLKYRVKDAAPSVAAKAAEPARYDAAKRASDECEAQGIHNGYPLTPEGKAFMACYTPLYQRYSAQE